MKILLFAIIFLSYTATGQETSEAPDLDVTTPEPVTEGSGEEEDTTTTTTTVKTTTEADPCKASANCGMNQFCPTDCNCKNYSEAILVKSLYGYCAEPCDSNYVWCSNDGECSPGTGKDVTCDCGMGRFEDGDNCVTGKFFGGEITFTTNYADAKNDSIKEVLKKLYNCEEVRLLSVVEGSTIVEYILIYKSDSNATDEVIQEYYNEKTGSCTSGNSTYNDTYIINCAESHNKTTSLSTCDIYTDCDLTTTTCNEYTGFLSCQCKDKYKKATPDANTCLKIPCLSSSECNDPFGTCEVNGEDELQSYCSCMWGFEGASCAEPWGFVFTILTGVLGILLIIVLTVCICNSTKSKSVKEDKTEDMNLKNPFIDFQPGLVRAKVPNNMYSVSDTYDMSARDAGRQNGAYDHAHDDGYGKQTSTFQHEYQTVDNRKSGAGADYF